MNYGNFGRPGFGFRPRPGFGFRPRPGYGSGYGFGVPFLLGAATATVLSPNYYRPYPYYPYYY